MPDLERRECEDVMLECANTECFSVLFWEVVDERGRVVRYVCRSCGATWDGEGAGNV